MPLNPEQIKAALSAFAADWLEYDGTERSGAQTFLNGLFACFDQDLTRLQREDKVLEAFQGGKFLDLKWPGVCIIEMKAPTEAGRLKHHRKQALDYWTESADDTQGIAAPPYVVLCAFQKFEIWEPGRFPKAPRIEFDLRELSDHYDSLLFLVGDEPVFVGGHVAVTEDAAKKLADVNRSLAQRGEGRPDERREFLLQCVWSMFAEDLGQIPKHTFTRILNELIANPKQRSSADELGQLFTYLNDPAKKRPEHGLYAGVPYANGGLFEKPARLHLNVTELKQLRAASAENWNKIEPQIFGSLLEGVLGHDQQWDLGAHYTHDAEMEQIIQPTIVRPWQDRIDSLKTPKDAERAQTELMNFVVLDPACGSGNFLYLAYRALRRIERDLHAKEAELRDAAGMPEVGRLSVFFPIANIRGIELDPFAVRLARVTLWMGHSLAVRELGLDESTLPLADLSGIVRGDALQLDWPRADAIIGNPPYHGSQNLRQQLGDERLEWLQEKFGVGVQDLCVYWFRKAADVMEPGARAGLVGTNSVSQNRARGASLNYMVEKGGVITDAISRQKWPGEAVVNVSIVNWIHKPTEPPSAFRLDSNNVVGISTRLRESKVAIEEYAKLDKNAGRSFQGPIPAGNFYLEPDEARELLELTDANYAEVIRPFLVGDDIADDPEQGPRRWIIDFNALPLEKASLYPAAMKIVRERVKPSRDVNRDRGFRERWWLFGRPRGELRTAIEPLARYIAGNRVGKRFLFSWQPANVCTGDAGNVFAFDDDYTMGILTSVVHQTWAKSESSTLRVDLRYTPTTCFETFPFPSPTPKQRATVGDISAELISERQKITIAEQIGLTELYNQIDEGAYADIAKLHKQLDKAVLAAYGWLETLADDPIELKAKLAEKHAWALTAPDYEPFPVLAGQA